MSWIRRTGRSMAMVNAPEFDLNDPFTLIRIRPARGYGRPELQDPQKEKQELLNQMWRNPLHQRYL